MQILVKDIFRLQSLHKARLIAGKGGVYRPVSGATILEMTEMDRDNATELLEFSLKAQEVMITALYNVKNSPEKQCDVIRILNNLHAAGLIVFYYGLVVSRFDERVLSLCDELRFPLIVLDYSESKNVAYADVLNEIYSLRRHGNDTCFRAAVNGMWQIRQDGGSVRDALCRIASPGRLDIAVIDIASRHVLCTTLSTEAVERFAAEALGVLPISTPAFELSLRGVKYYGQRHYTDYLGASILLICQPAEKAPDTEMVFSCAKLCVDFWRRELVLTRGDSLINAIIQGNLQQAQSDLDYYRKPEGGWWHFLICDARLSDGGPLHGVKSQLRGEDISYVAGHFERLHLILFQRQLDEGILDALVEEGVQAVPDVQLCYAAGLNDEDDMFRLLRFAAENYGAVCALFQNRRIIGRFELLAAESCARACGEESAWYDAQRLLQPLIEYDKKRNGLLLETLQIFLIDCDRSYRRTSELMFIHQNTIQYRVRKAVELLGTSFEQTASLAEIYRALCIYRQNIQKLAFKSI